MNIFVTGINYKTAPLEIREKLSFTASEKETVLNELTKLPEVKECILLSTCNRTEVYIYSDCCDFKSEQVQKVLCDLRNVDIYRHKKYFYFYSSQKAVRHLFNVASGLDSMVLGEDQILGQVKGAHELAMGKGVSSVILNTLFREAATAAKKVKTYTELSKNSISVASLSVKLASKAFGGDLGNRCALVIGAGEIGMLVIKNLISRGIKEIFVTNRTHRNAEVLAEIHESVVVIDYGSRYSVLDQCDIIISSTTSPHYTITVDMAEKFINNEKNRVFVDLAVPRDIDISIRGIPGVKYFDMDDLKLTVDENIDKRLLEVTKAEEIIDEFVLEFEKWYQFREVLPVINEVRKYTDDMLNKKVSSTLSRLKCASDEDKEVVRASIANMVNGILDVFIYRVREHSKKEDIEAYFKCLNEVIKNEQLSR